MDEVLKDILNKYKAATIEIMEVIESDNIDSLMKLVGERQKVVDEALKMTYEKETMQQIYAELKLDELQSELNSLVTGKLSSIKCEMEKIDKSKTANNVYNNGNFINAQILNKKI